MSAGKSLAPPRAWAEPEPRGVPPYYFPIHYLYIVFEDVDTSKSNYWTKLKTYICMPGLNALFWQEKLFRFATGSHPIWNWSEWLCKWDTHGSFPPTCLGQCIAGQWLPGWRAQDSQACISHFYFKLGFFMDMPSLALICSMPMPVYFIYTEFTYSSLLENIVFRKSKYT